MLTIGKHTLRIREHRLSELNGKEVVRIDGQTEDGDEVQVLIWLTDKSMGIARAQLRICGFDVDTNELDKLHYEQFLLSGKTIPIITEDYKGQLRSQILLNSEPSRKRMKELTSQLRAAKRDGQEVPIQEITGGNSESFVQSVDALGQHLLRGPQTEETDQDLPF